MPYITVRMWSGRSDEVKQAVAYALGDALCESLGCPATAVTLEIEEIDKEDWQEQIMPIIESRKDKMIIMEGTERADW